MSFTTGYGCGSVVFCGGQKGKLCSRRSVNCVSAGGDGKGDNCRRVRGGFLLGNCIFEKMGWEDVEGVILGLEENLMLIKSNGRIKAVVILLQDISCAFNIASKKATALSFS